MRGFGEALRADQNTLLPNSHSPVVCAVGRIKTMTAVGRWADVKRLGMHEP